MTCRLLVCLIGWALSLSCYASVNIEPYSVQEFNPASNQTFSLPVNISESGNIEVAIYTSDGDLVRTLPSVKKDKAGVHQIIWDGRDQDKIIVPNEAYIPVIKLTTSSTTYVYDPRLSSGGEEISITPQINTEGQIVFQLDRASRILARAGIKSGPMLKSILNWQVRGKGRNVVFWNGYDRDNLMKLVGSSRMALLVTGFELPNHAILTVGNKTLSYSAWRIAHEWSSSLPDLTKTPFERDGHRLSRHYYLPRSVDIEPRISLEIIDQLSKNKQGIPIVTSSILLKVGMHNGDRWAMQQSLYEVAFFADNEFLSEEEQGYVPLTWRWNPAGLKSGIHLITVNVSGFNGQVGVKSLQIEIPGERGN